MSLGAPKMVKANDPDTVDRTVYFDLRLAATPLDPALAEAGGQPEISTNYTTYTATGIGTLTHIGNGRYSAVLTQAAVLNVGTYIRTRYKSANTVESSGDHIFTVAQDPGDDHVALITASVIAGLTGNIGVVVLPTTSQQLTLAQAMTVCRSALRDQDSDAQGDTDIREAIRTLVSDFLNNTKINNTVATFTATIDSPILDLSSVAGFRAERFIRAQIDFNDPLEYVDYSTISRELDESSESGEPQFIAFDTATTAYVSPRPETAASIKIKYSLAANSLDNDTDTIQIPAEYLRPALWWGVPALLRNAEHLDVEADRGWAKYREIVRGLQGVGVANRGNFNMDLTKFN